MSKLPLYRRMVNLDRRIIYIILAVFVVFPMIVPLGLKNPSNKETRDLFNFIENAAKERPIKPILISGDYEPSTLAELKPMLKAIIRHCFKKDVPIVLMTLFPGGVGTVENTMSEVVKEYKEENIEKIYGEDYCFLGYKPGYSSVIMGIGAGLKRTFPTDKKGTKLEDIPMMANIGNYDDFSLVVSITGTKVGENWMTFANGRYHVPVALGVTAVMASDYFPFLQSGQITGLLGGIRGAAEYEELIDERDLGAKGMESQNFAHLIIVLFIIIGNIAYYFEKRDERIRRESR